MKLHHIFNQLRGLAAASVAALTLAGCSDFLEIEPRDVIVLEQFWNEKADVDAIVAGCYTQLQSDACISRMIIWGEARSENMSPGNNVASSNVNLLNVLNENIISKNPYTTWVDFYSVINRCNTVIKYAPGVAEDDPGYTQSELQATIAEVTALRSLCYFYLIRAFRDVPFSREAYTDDDQEMELPATPFDVVLDSLIYDLESVKDMAVDRYPTTTPLYQTGRITKEAINAMLCEMYLWKQDYDRCIQYADAVIESKKKIAEEIQAGGIGSNRGGGRGGRGGSGGSSNDNFARTNGYPLLNNLSGTNDYGRAYNYMFTDDDYTEYAQQEIIFQLVFNDRPSANSMPNNSTIATLYGNSGLNNASGQLAPSDYLLDDIGKSTGRTVFDDRNKTVDCRMYTNVYSKAKSINKYVSQNITVDVSKATEPAVSGYDTKWGQNDCGSNWIIYRLSDIMLMKAEALAQKLQEGSDAEVISHNKPYLDEVFSLVNAVNKRSICQSELKDTLVATDYATKAQMETLVLRERQRELMFEGKRWFDLVRQARRDGATTQLSSAALQKVTTGSALIANKLSKMDAIYWPYNYEELKANTKLHQNPAYGSGENESYK